MLTLFIVGNNLKCYVAFGKYAKNLHKLFAKSSVTEAEALEFLSYNPPITSLLVPNEDMLRSLPYFTAVVKHLPNLQEIDAAVTYSHFYEDELQGFQYLVTNSTTLNSIVLPMNFPVSLFTWLASQTVNNLEHINFMANFNLSDDILR